MMQLSEHLIEILAPSLESIAPFIPGETFPATASSECPRDVLIHPETNPRGGWCAGGFI